MDRALGRYHRQMLLPDIGEAGQRRLLASHAVIVGCGALGCASADLLARAGVGVITLVDRDVVELTNLQRQTLFSEEDARRGMPKAEAARARLAQVNSAIELRAAVVDLTARQAESVLDLGGRRAGVIVDGTDNFETRYLLNDLAVREGIALCYGGVIAGRGMQMTILPGDTPCLRCVFEEPPAAGSSPTCDTAGVLGPAVSIVAACQAADAIKVLLGRTDLVARTILDLDLWSGRRHRVDPGAPRADCPCCARREFPYLAGESGGLTAALCGRQAVQVTPTGAGAVDLAALAKRLEPHGTFTTLGRMLVRGDLRGERSPDGGTIGVTVFADGRAIISGTTRVDVARAVYARYIGA